MDLGDCFRPPILFLIYLRQPHLKTLPNYILYHLISNDLNQSKNIATQLVASPEGVETVGRFTSFQLPFLINAGLYAEAEDLINYVYSFMDFKSSALL